MVYEEFVGKTQELITGMVTRTDPRSGALHVKIGSGRESTEALLTAKEQVPGESYREGDRIKVYVVEVRRGTRGTQVLISRTHYGLVRRLFEMEVPEIYDGVVEIRSIAREAGSRTKMAVWSNDEEVDPIGACVGARGARVNTIVDELHGEKEGQNARLAAKLTGYKIDIKSESNADEEDEDLGLFEDEDDLFDGAAPETEDAAEADAEEATETPDESAEPDAADAAEAVESGAETVENPEEAQEENPHAPMPGLPGDEAQAGADPGGPLPRGGDLPGLPGQEARPGRLCVSCPGVLKTGPEEPGSGAGLQRPAACPGLRCAGSTDGAGR